MSAVTHQYTQVKNGIAYTYNKTYQVKNTTRGRPKLTEAEKIERAFKKQKAKYDAWKESQLISKGPDFVNVQF